MKVRLTRVALLACLAVLLIPVQGASAARDASVRAKAPVLKSATNRGIKFGGVYRTTGRAHRLSIRVVLQYEFQPGKWATFVDHKLRRSRRGASRVAVSGRGPCLAFGRDRYRTVASGFVTDDQGKRKLRRRDVSAPRTFVC